LSTFESHCSLGLPTVSNSDKNLNPIQQSTDIANQEAAVELAVLLHNGILCRLVLVLVLVLHTLKSLVPLMEAVS
jgi:hypothetical protein